MSFFLPGSQEEELSSSSSEEEEAERPVNDELLGKVVSVDCVAPGDKKKSAWYPALVRPWAPEPCRFWICKQLKRHHRVSGMQTHQ